MSTQSIFRATRSPRYETQWQRERRTGQVILPMPNETRRGFIARVFGK